MDPKRAKRTTLKESLIQARNLGWEPDESFQSFTCLKCNFIRFSSLSAIKSNPSCRPCVGKNPGIYYKRAEEERRLRAAKHGYTVGELSRTFFCQNNHKRITRIAEIERIPECIECKFIEQTKVVIEQVETKWNIKHVGEIPSRSKHSTEWECSNGHSAYRFSNNPYRLFHSGKPCHECARRRRTESQIKSRSPKNADYLKLQKETGYKLVGEIPKMGTVKTRWLCPNEHNVFVSYAYLKKHGVGCKPCAQRILGELTRKTIKDYIALGEKCGLRPLFDEVPRQANLKVIWECISNSDHTKVKESFENLREIASTREGRRKLGCVKCAGIKLRNGKEISESQQRIFEMLSVFAQFGPRRQNYKLAGGKFFPDMIMKGPNDKKLAVSYDSFRYHRIGKNKQAHEQMETLYLLSYGYHVLRIRDNGSVPGRNSKHYPVYRDMVIKAAYKALRQRDEYIVETEKWKKSAFRYYR